MSSPIDSIIRHFCKRKTAELAQTSEGGDMVLNDNQSATSPPPSQTSLDATPITYDPNLPSIINLDVGGKMFRVRPETLSQSPVLRSMVNERGETSGSDSLPQNTVFIDEDPNLFEHLMGFLRHPDVFPLFYDARRGFDYDLYNKLENAADYFGIASLVTWIKEKNYVNAIKIQRGIPYKGPMDEMPAQELSGNQKEERHALVNKRRVYVCPRNIPFHRGHPERCGNECAKRRAGGPLQYDEEKWVEITSVVTTTIFDENVCKAELEDDGGIQLEPEADV